MPPRSTPKPFAPDGSVSLLQQSMWHSRTAFGLVDADTQALVWANPAFEQWLSEQPLPQERAPFAGDDELQAALLACIEGLSMTWAEHQASHHRVEFVALAPGLIQCLVTPSASRRQSRPAAPDDASQISVLQSTLDMLDELPLNALLCTSAGQVFWTNKAFKQFSGNHSHSFDFSGDDWMQSMHPDDRLVASKTFSSSMRSGQLEPFRYRAKDWRGSFQWLLCLGAPLKGTDGQVLSWLIVNVNINRFKLYEELLENRIWHQLAAQERDRARLLHAQELAAQAQKMELVSNLAGGVAHDLNNMLFIMGLNADLLRRQLSEPTARENIEAIRSSIRKAARLSSQLTSFSGRKPQSVSSVNPGTALDELRELLLRAVGAEVDFSLSIAPDAGSILVDKMYFENALINLAINARDAVEGRGRVALRIFNRQLVHEGEPREFVVFEVQDNGTGMSEEVQRKVFEPFFTTKAPGKGTGLGLPMVKLFVDNSGGFIDIRSRPREGTTVALHFPHSRVSTAEARATDAPYQLGSESVLVIEDDAEVRETVAHTLNILGYNIVAAVNPEHAWQLLQDGLRIDLIISDIKMPGKMTVIDFLRRLEQQGLDIPVIFATGYSADVLVQENLVEGRHPVMFKPFSLQEMSHQVRSVLGVLSPEQE